MICRTYLTTFAILEDDDGYPIEFAAFGIADDGNRNYRFHMHFGGLSAPPANDLAWRFLAYVPEGSDILSVIPLSGQRPLAESFEIGTLASAFRMLGLPIEGYGRMHVLRTSEWQLVQSAFDHGLPYRGPDRKRGLEGQIALLPLRAQAIWLAWLSETRDIQPSDKRDVLAAWQAWRALVRIGKGTAMI